ncbi:MAG: succinate dehydrogenase/fumarate reductase iron-sulfur subunit [Desulfoarculaceae bacterium]|nr:succinate dehydrogenase/fumarate reductase iron-sulfur subunit [Desulfoarculaceae bacterium]
MSRTISLTLRIWRQENGTSQGAFETYRTGPISTEMSFLEMLDVVGERLTLEGKEPVAFDHDCREGICGMCGAVVNGQAHGHQQGTTLCQLHMRHFKDGDTLVIEPFRSRAFPLIKDLVVDRSAFDSLIAEGGYVSVNTGGAIEANTLAIPRKIADLALDAAECIGCGACVAACPNGAAMLFVGAKVSHLALLPQGQPERSRRVLAMVRKMDELGFGSCGNRRECEAACPKRISISNVARLNREFLKASLLADEE